MITKIELTNFKSHAHTVIEPGRVTALVGPNGCGKTGMLQAVYCMGSLVNKPPSQIFIDELAPDHLVREYGSSFSIKVIPSSSKFNSDVIEFELATQTNYVGQVRTWEGELSGRFQSAPIGMGRSGLNDFPALLKHLPKAITEELGPVEYFKASPKKIAQPSSLEEIPPKLSSDGSGLSSVIANLILSEPERLLAIEKELCQIVPTVKKIKVRHTKLHEVENTYYLEKGQVRPTGRSIYKPGYEMLFDTRSANNVPSHSMSEGTLLILGMLTLLHSPHPPAIFLMEDLEQGLHPLAQRQFIQVIQSLAEKQNRQIILTSHSPYIVDALDAKDVWVMATDKEGISHAKRLSDHPDAKRALDVLTTGELWDAEGESWVLEHTPTETVNA